MKEWITEADAPKEYSMFEKINGHNSSFQIK